MYWRMKKLKIQGGYPFAFYSILSLNHEEKFFLEFKPVSLIASLFNLCHDYVCPELWMSFLWKWKTDKGLGMSLKFPEVLSWGSNWKSISGGYWLIQKVSANAQILAQVRGK